MPLILPPPSPDIVQAIVDRAERSLELHRQVANLLLPLDRLKKFRQLVAVDAVVIGAELHGGVALLTRFAHYAAANALMRPLIETSIRAIWVSYVAPYDKVVGIANNRDATTLGKMLQKLEGRNDLSVISEFAKALGLARSSINSFTHVGYEQLSRREVGFKPEEIMAQLMVADLFAIICIDLAGLVYGKSEIKNEVLPKLMAAMTELKALQPDDRPLGNNGLPKLPLWPTSEA